MSVALPKIKLLVAIPNLQCGGTEKYVSLLCNYIDTEKFAVTLLVLNNNKPFYRITNPAITVIDLKTQRVSHSFFKIKQAVKNTQPAIIYTNGNHLNLFFAIFKNLLSAKAVLTARESSIVSINSQRAKNKVLYNRLLRFFYKRIDGIICQSVYMQQDLLNNYGIKNEKTIIIHNPVQVNDAMPVSPATANKFITVARLSTEKGIDRLIRSVAKLSIPFQYYIIGEGNQKEMLQGLINELGLQNQIHLTGEKKQPFNDMADAGLFLMGSYYEGFPNVLLEAAALGIPSVAFDVPGGIKEIIVDGQNGLLVKEADEGAFAQAIKKALSTGFNREQIKNNTRSIFSPTKIINYTEEFFSGLLDQRE